MKCPDYEKWISDSLDGVLAEDKKVLLDLHLKQCPFCRAYRKRLSRIQEEAGQLRIARLAPSYWEELSAAVRKRVEEFEEGRSQERAVRLRWRWAWAAVLSLAVLLGLLLRPRTAPAFGPDAFSFEACLGRLNQEVGDDLELAGNFNFILLNTLRQDLSSAALEDNPVLSEDALFWEGLSEEEWQILDEEIKKELKS